MGRWRRNRTSAATRSTKKPRTTEAEVLMREVSAQTARETANRAVYKEVVRKRPSLGCGERFHHHIGMPISGRAAGAILVFVQLASIRLWLAARCESTR
jgi:hypothetical protein